MSALSAPDALLHSMRVKLLVVVAVALAVLGFLAARSWLASHDAAVQLAATVKTQKELLDQAAAREQQRDSTLAKTLAGITQAKRAVQTPAEAAAQISSVLPQLPEPISVAIPAPTPAEPTPPAAASVPQSDLKPLYDALQDCRACQAQLVASQADLADERSKVSALGLERDAALKAAHGGGLWSRVGRAAKWLLIGAAAGAIAASAARR